MSFFGGRRQQYDSYPEDDPTPQPSAQAPRPVGFDTVLGANATLTGDLRSQANVRLDGVFEGTLEIEGNVLIGESAKITADVNARNISIAGAVRGNVNGNKVQILRTGRVWGDIHARAISTEEGAFIDGKITMIEHAAALEGMDTPELPAGEDAPAAAFAEDAVEVGEIVDDGDDQPAASDPGPAEDNSPALDDLPRDSDGAFG